LASLARRENTGSAERLITCRIASVGAMASSNAMR
jgi:hypothetical protein